MYIYYYQNNRFLIYIKIIIVTLETWKSEVNKNWPKLNNFNCHNRVFDTNIFRLNILPGGTLIRYCGTDRLFFYTFLVRGTTSWPNSNFYQNHAVVMTLKFCRCFHSKYLHRRRFSVYCSARVCKLLKLRRISADRVRLVFQYFVYTIRSSCTSLQMQRKVHN